LTSTSPRTQKGHSFGNAYIRLNTYSNGGVVHHVGDGKLTQFWGDVWLTPSPLRLCFPRLFNICEDEFTSVAECAERGWQLVFRRLLGDEEMQEWRSLQSMLEGVVITNEDDKIAWGLSSSKQFTTSSLYRFLRSGGVTNKMARDIWSYKVPLKI
jgi:hypothetical protein